MTAPSSILRWIAIAFVGLAIAAVVAFAASKLVSQRIGLSSQPLNAGKELAPPETHPSHAQKPANRSATTTTTTTTTTIPAPPSTTTLAPGTSAPSSDGSASEGQGPDD